MEQTLFEKLIRVNVNDKVEKKKNLSYLSWAFAWAEFIKVCPDAKYEVIKNDSGLPYFSDDAGAMVYTKVTVNELTHEMWLPVMNGANKALKAEPYSYKTRNGDQSCEAYTMFDINKTIMRCLVKNLAMFGLGLYIYAGEDMPTVDIEYIVKSQQEEIAALLKESKSDVNKFLQFIGVGIVGDIQSKDFFAIRDMIKAKIK